MRNAKTCCILILAFSLSLSHPLLLFIALYFCCCCHCCCVYFSHTMPKMILSPSVLTMDYLIHRSFCQVILYSILFHKQMRARTHTNTIWVRIFMRCFFFSVLFVVFFSPASERDTQSNRYRHCADLFQFSSTLYATSDRFNNVRCVLSCRTRIHIQK